MKPQKIEFFAYADSDAEVKELEAELRSLVHEYYSEGIYVNASKLTNLIRTYKNTFFFKQILR